MSSGNESRRQITDLLGAVSRGQGSSDTLMEMIYPELKRLAAVRMTREPSEATLQPTALVHEAFLRLVGKEEDAPSWKSRAHFFGAASRAMRRILVEHARRRRSLKRGGALRRLTLSGVGIPDPNGVETLDLDEALQALERRDRRAAETFKLRFFSGLDVDECALLLGVSQRTVVRDWRVARAWIGNELQGGES